MTSLAKQLDTLPVMANPREWIAIADVARRLEMTPRHVRRLCSEKWEQAALAIQQPASGGGAGGGQWLINVRADPKLAMHIPTAPTIAPATSEILKYPLRKRRQAEQKAMVVLAWRQSKAARSIDVRDWLPALIDDLRSQYPDLKISRTSLYRWDELAGDPIEAIRFIDTRGAPERLNDSDPFFAEVRRLYLRTSKPRLSVCYQMAMMTAEENGWPVCSYTQIRRRVATISKASIIKLRDGDKAFEDQIEPFIKRDYSNVAANECWNADHHVFDVLVHIGDRLNKKTGELEPIYGRPWLSAWQDVGSRKIPGWVIRAEPPNTDTVIESLRLGCESHGVPEWSYTDNGKDFRSAVLTGEPRAMRWQRRKYHVALDQNRMDGIYGGLQIKRMHAWPYHGQSKPIERFFRTVEDRWGRLWPTYCGNTTTNKPQDLAKALAAGKAPTLAEFVESFEAWLEADYHARIHRGDAMGMTPNAAFVSKLVTKRTAPSEVLTELLKKRIGPRTVGQAGVCYQTLYYGERNLDLCSRIGQEVWLRVNDNDLTSVTIWTADDRFIGVAQANQKLPFMATSTELRQAIAEKRSDRRKIVAAIEPKSRRNEHLPARLIRAAQAKMEIAAKANEPPTRTPLTIRPIRSPIEDSLTAMRVAQTQATFRKAVGDDTPHRDDEPAPSRFSYGPTLPASNDEQDASPASGFTYVRPAEENK